MKKEKLSHHPHSQSNVGHLNHLIRDQKFYDFDIDFRHRRSQPQAVRPHPRRLSLTLYFPFLYHSGYVSDLIMLTRTVLRSTRLASQRRSPLGRQSIVAIPTNSISEKHI